jgi:hypothetical protein
MYVIMTFDVISTDGRIRQTAKRLVMTGSLGVACDLSLVDTHTRTLVTEPPIKKGYPTVGRLRGVGWVMSHASRKRGFVGSSVVKRCVVCCPF